MQPYDYTLDINKGAVGPLAAAMVPTLGQPQGMPQGAPQGSAGGPLAQAGGAPPPLPGLPQGAPNAFMNSQIGAAQQFKQQEAAAAAQAELKADWLEMQSAGTTAATGAFLLKHPEFEPRMKASFDRQSAAEQKDSLMQAAAARAAIKNGEPKTAVLYLRDNAAALKNSGLTERADALNQMADQIEAHEESALATIDLFGHVNGGKEWVEAQQKIDEGPAALKKAEADAAKLTVEADNQQAKDLAAIGLDQGRLDDIRSQISNRVAQLGLDERRVRVLEREAALKAKELDMKKGEISEKESAEVAANVVSAVMANDAATEYDAAADIYKETASGVGGVLASPFNQGVGLQATRAVTGAAGVARPIDKADQALLRAEMAEARARRPPGSGTYTDADAERDAKASISQITTPAAKESRMRELAKKQRKTAALDTVKAEYMNQNGTYGPAKRDIVVGGKKIEKGSSFERAVGAATAESADKGPPPASRIAELKASGISKDEAMRKLRAEGYTVGGHGG